MAWKKSRVRIPLAPPYIIILFRGYMELNNILQIIWPLILIQAFFQIYAIIDLVVIKKRKTKKMPFIAWFLIIILGQMVGPALYFIIGRSEE